MGGGAQPVHLHWGPCPVCLGMFPTEGCSHGNGGSPGQSSWDTESHALSTCPPLRQLLRWVGRWLAVGGEASHQGAGSGVTPGRVVACLGVTTSQAGHGVEPLGGACKYSQNNNNRSGSLLSPSCPSPGGWGVVAVVGQVASQQQNAWAKVGVLSAQKGSLCV